MKNQICTNVETVLFNLLGDRGYGLQITDSVQTLGYVFGYRNTKNAAI